MGFLNKQWLKGSPERNRKHRPEKVAVTSESVSNAWDREHGIEGVVRIKGSNGNYQLLLFTGEELAKVLPTLVRSAGTKTRQEISIEALLALDDSELVNLLGHVFRERNLNKV